MPIEKLIQAAEQRREAEIKTSKKPTEQPPQKTLFNSRQHER